MSLVEVKWVSFCRNAEDRGVSQIFTWSHDLTQTS